MFLIVANRGEMCAFWGEGDIGGAGTGDSGEKKVIKQ